jgi:hypothetical protein
MNEGEVWRKEPIRATTFLAKLALTRVSSALSPSAASILNSLACSF